MRSRVDNILSWVKRLARLCRITALSQELVRFGLQRMEHPEISGVQYQQGELFGYEVREYLLEKWRRTCTYCGATNIPLQVEHIVPRARGGTDRISNLCLACESCNLAKGTQDVRDFLAHGQGRLTRLLAQANQFGSRLSPLPTSPKGAPVSPVLERCRCPQTDIYGTILSSLLNGKHIALISPTFDKRLHL